MLNIPTSAHTRWVSPNNAGKRNGYGFTDLGVILKLLHFFLFAFLAYEALALSAAAFGIVALAMHLVANSVFIVLMAVGPVFLLCSAFPFLQRFLETFIGNVMTNLLGMAFTALIVFLVADLFGLTTIASKVPPDVSPTAIGSHAKSLVVYFRQRAERSWSSSTCAGRCSI